MPKLSSSHTPLVTIGIPVFNEARFLEAALASLLNQDYPNIEFIIYDNASTDETPDICQQAAARDDRVRVTRANANEGSSVNFMRCLDAAKGEMFMWAGGHDLWSENVVSECVAALQAHPGAVVAVPESRWIDASSVTFGTRTGLLDTRGMDPLARIFTLLWANMHPVYGVMRTSVLRSSEPSLDFSGADLVLLARLILKGDFVPARNALWSRRQTRTCETIKDRQRRYSSGDHRMGKTAFPLLRLAISVVGTVWASDLPTLDKFVFTLAFPGLLPARYQVARRRKA